MSSLLAEDGVLVIACHMRMRYILLTCLILLCSVKSREKKKRKYPLFLDFLS